jgi:hypothetical protein
MALPQAPPLFLAFVGHTTRSALRYTSKIARSLCSPNSWQHALLVLHFTALAYLCPWSSLCCQAVFTFQSCRRFDN